MRVSTATLWPVLNLVPVPIYYYYYYYYFHCSILSCNLQIFSPRPRMS